jgi:hypothetical protein
MVIGHFDLFLSMRQICRDDLKVEGGEDEIWCQKKEEKRERNRFLNDL